MENDRPEIVAKIFGWWFFCRDRWHGCFDDFDETRRIGWGIAPDSQTELKIIKITKEGVQTVRSTERPR